MLKVGDKAPAFELTSDAGKVVRRSDFENKTLVVYFYPKDDTPGCTTEAIAFSEAMKHFAAAGAAVVGVSKDSVASHCKFRDKYALKIPLLSDPDLAVHNAFGTYGEKMMYGKKIQGTIRSTFVVGPDGTIIHVFPKVKVLGHVGAVLALIAEKTATEAPPKAPGKSAAAARKAPVKRS